MSDTERPLRDQDIGLYLDDDKQPAGIKLFSTSAIDERLATDSLGQFHFTRWRKFGDVGWKVDFSFTLSAQATHGLIRFLRTFTSTPADGEPETGPEPEKK